MARRSRQKTSSSHGGNRNSVKRARTVDLGGAGVNDEHIDSSDDEDEMLEGDSSLQEFKDDEEEGETLEAKKVRLAREYLDKIDKASEDSSSMGEESDDDDDDDDNDDDEGEDRVGSKLRRLRQTREGTLERALADNLAERISKIKKDVTDKKRINQQTSLSSTPATTTSEQEYKDWISSGYIKLLRGHDLTPTCVALQSNGERSISGSKDHSVILWDVEHCKKIIPVCDSWRKKQQNIEGKTSSSLRTEGQVLSVACSDDGRYAVVGKRDSTVSIYDIRVSSSGKQNNNLIKTFTEGKSAVTSLTFQSHSLQLFSGSEDRCIRHYNLDEMLHLGPLYGHQFGVTGIDCHRKERPISVGRDRTARAWKITEETHLIFRAGSKVSSADCISVVKDDWFLTGHDDGHVCLWMTEKKKTVDVVANAHHSGSNLDGTINGEASTMATGVVSIDCCKSTDVAATGSNDGYVRFWKVMTGQALEDRGIEPLSQIPLNGFINGIAVGPKARFCVVAVGQEPRLGRWSRVPKAQNRFGIIQLYPAEDR